MANSTTKTVLVSPLNWGLGHASRVVPIIRFLQSEGHRVIAAADGAALAFLQRNIPELEFHILPDISVHLPATGSVSVSLLKQSFSFFGAMRTELRNTQDLVSLYKPDLILSDNRYGVRNNDVQSIMITHQIYPPFPALIEGVGHRTIGAQLRNFSEVWVPDFEGEVNLSGALSHRPKGKVKKRFIGPLSRLSSPKKREKKNNILAIISGPEPLRTSIEQKVTELLQTHEGKHILLCGRPNNSEKRQVGNLTIIPHLEDAQLQQTIEESELVIGSCGYSNVMDLYSLQANALLFPSPGQSEQEFLANHLNGKFNFESCRLEELEYRLAKGKEKKDHERVIGSPSEDWKELLSEYLK